MACLQLVFVATIYALINFCYSHSLCNFVSDFQSLNIVKKRNTDVLGLPRQCEVCMGSDLGNVGSGVPI